MASTARPQPHPRPVAPAADRGADPAARASSGVVGLLSVIAEILSAWALKASAVVTMPLAFAFFVAILVHPIERGLALRLPQRLEWLGVTCAMLTVVGTLALALALASSASAAVCSRPASS